MCADAGFSHVETLPESRFRSRMAFHVHANWTLLGLCGLRGALLMVALWLATGDWCQSSVAMTLGLGTAVPVSVVGPETAVCNAVSFAQFPDDLDLFLGRVDVDAPPRSCTGNQWSLALFKMDWVGSALRYVDAVMAIPADLPPGVGIRSGAQLTSAYDPTIARYHGELWVAFECWGKNFSGVSACIAPLRLTDSQSARVDLQRLSVAVSGTSTDASSPYQYSASVPKIFTFRNRIYLYWSVVQFPWGGNETSFLNVTTRGMELEEDAGRLWGKHSNGASIPSLDPSRNIEVLGLVAGDPLSDSAADMFGVHADETTIYATAGVGGKGCVTPSQAIYGCYRLRISATTDPLGFRTFNRNILSSHAAPANPQELTRFVKHPSDGLFLMGSYIESPKEYPLTNTLPPGFWRYPVAPREWTFSTLRDGPGAKTAPQGRGP